LWTLLLASFFGFLDADIPVGDNLEGGGVKEGDMTIDSTRPQRRGGDWGENMNPEAVVCGGVESVALVGIMIS